MKINRLALLTGLFCTVTSSVFGQSIIANREVLNALLGSNRADEGFETANPGGAATGGGTLTSTNWGSDPFSGLVISGISFRSTYPVQTPEEYWIQWNGTGFKGIPSKNIFSSGSLMVDFGSPTIAFGIDLKDFTLYRNTLVAGVTVYGADDTTVIYQDNSITLSDPANGVFFGYQFGSGIGGVEFRTVSGADPNNDAPHIFSPKIDNLAFSTISVPEPSTVWLTLLGIGALAFRLRRK